MRKEILRFLVNAKDVSGLSYSALSYKAGIAPSTITRFVKDKNLKEISLSSLNKIADAAGFNNYENYLSEIKNSSKNIIISDIAKFEIYEIVRKILSSKQKKFKQEEAADITKDVVEHAVKLGTDFISDSLVMYVIEKRENERK